MQLTVRRKTRLKLFLIAIFACSTACSPRVGAPALPGVISTRELEAGVHVAGIAVGPNGDVWLATLNYGYGRAGIIHVGLDGAMRRFERPESFNRVVVDARGTAWFTVGAGASGQQPKLVRVDPAGHMHDYPLPPEGNFQGITIGPDGAPWFVDAASGEIGRIASDGAITYYGPASSDPTEIVGGRDGDLWFTEPNGNLIGRLAPDGTLKEFRVPTPASRPAGITVGADGDVWFCESSGNKIARITPSGHVVESPVPTADAWPIGIAASRRGALWFSELTAGKIGRIEPSGKVTEFAVAGGGYPGPIARAPDGSMWIVSNAKRDAAFGLTTLRGHLVRFAAH